MQKVERRKRKEKHSRRQVWVVACVVSLAAAVFAAIRLNRPILPESVSIQEDSRGSIVNRNTQDIQSITIRMKSRESWTIIRGEDGKLHLEDSPEWTVDETLGKRIQDAMANIVYEAVLSEDPTVYEAHSEEFGLDDPELIATVVFIDREKVTVRFGKESGLEDEDFHYMTVDGDHRLYAAASSLMEDLQVEAELLHPVEQPGLHSSRMDRITVMNGDGTLRVEWKLKGSIQDPDAAENWFLTAPVTYPADYDKMQNLKKNAENLRMGIWAGEATENNLAAYGLILPSAILEIHMAAGTTGQITAEGAYNTMDWKDSLVRIEIGDMKNDLVCYVRWQNQIYTMNRFTLETLTEASPLGTVARYPVIVPLDTLSDLTVETDGNITEYTLTREANPAAKDGDSAEFPAIVRCMKDGTEIPYSAFEAAYERWMVITVSGKLPADWEKRESSVKYTFRSTSGTEHVLELSEFDAMHDAVTVDGCTLFYLIRDGITELP